MKYEYYDSGAVKWQCDLKDGGVTRECKFFFENGVMQAELLYENGRKNGISKYFFKNGNLSQIVTYHEGAKHGPYTLFYENGNIAERGNFCFNRRRGSVIRYYPSENGAPQTKYLFYSYNDTERTEFASERTEYNQDGTIIKVHRNFNVTYIGSGAIRMELKLPYDSGTLIIGNLDSLFFPAGEVDTIHFSNNQALVYSTENFSGEVLRGIWTVYKTTFDKDSIYSDMTMGLIEQPYPEP